MNKQLQKTYLGKNIVFTPDGWINMTQTIKALEAKRLDGFIKSKYIKDYLNAYCEFYDTKPEEVIRVVKGGDLRSTDPTKRVNDQGSYLHPDFVVLFARWISPKFAVWCHQVIKQIITGKIEIMYQATHQALQEEYDKLEEKNEKLFEELKLYQRPKKTTKHLKFKINSSTFFKSNNNGKQYKNKPKQQQQPATPKKRHPSLCRNLWQLARNERFV